MGSAAGLFGSALAVLVLLLGAGTGLDLVLLFTNFTLLDVDDGFGVLHTNLSMVVTHQLY